VPFSVKRRTYNVTPQEGKKKKKNLHSDCILGKVVKTKERKRRKGKTVPSSWKPFHYSGGRK